LRGGESGGSSGAPSVSQGEILSHLPEVVAMLKPLMGDSGSAERKSEEAETENVSSDAPSAASSETVGGDGAARAVSALTSKKYDKSRAQKLMAALKPYLNPSRCEIIDKCVSVMQITDVVEALQGIEGIARPKT
ncbi:MAG: hypothetical protein ACI4V1_02295, partial [Eubacteriales bacterium]